MIQEKVYYKEQYIQYIQSYYWATNIMMNVGFGDISALIHKEVIIVFII